MISPPKLKLLGHAKPRDSDHIPQGVKEEIQKKVDNLCGRIERWEDTCTRAYMLLREQDHYINELRKWFINDFELIKGY